MIVKDVNLTDGAALTVAVLDDPASLNGDRNAVLAVWACLLDLGSAWQTAEDAVRELAAAPRTVRAHVPTL